LSSGAYAGKKWGWGKLEAFRMGKLEAFRIVPPGL